MDISQYKWIAEPGGIDCFCGKKRHGAWPTEIGAIKDIASCRSG